MRAKRALPHNAELGNNFKHSVPNVIWGRIIQVHGEFMSEEGDESHYEVHRQ